MTYVKSTIDNNFYRVRDLPDKQIAANMLAKIRINIINLVDYMDKNKISPSIIAHRGHSYHLSTTMSHLSATNKIIILAKQKTKQV